MPVLGADVAEGDAGMRGLAVAGLQSHTHRPVVLRAPLTCLSALCFRQLDSHAATCEACAQPANGHAASPTACVSQPLRFPKWVASCRGLALSFPHEIDMAHAHSCMQAAARLSIHSSALSRLGRQCACSPSIRAPFTDTDLGRAWIDDAGAAPSQGLQQTSGTAAASRCCQPAQRCPSSLCSRCLPAPAQPPGAWPQGCGRSGCLSASAGPGCPAERSRTGVVPASCTAGQAYRQKLQVSVSMVNMALVWVSLLQKRRSMGQVRLRIRVGLRMMRCVVQL